MLREPEEGTTAEDELYKHLMQVTIEKVLE